MARCAYCGNEYHSCFDITMGEKTYAFDCFECAIAALAPTCDRCGCNIIGHGVEAPEGMFCSAHCSREHDVAGSRDRAA